MLNAEKTLRVAGLHAVGNRVSRVGVGNLHVIGLGPLESSRVFTYCLLDCLATTATTGTNMRPMILYSDAQRRFWVMGIVNALEIGEMVISAFIGLIGLGPASRVSTCSLLDRLLTATTNISICPHMTSYPNKMGSFFF